MERSQLHQTLSTSPAELAGKYQFSGALQILANAQEESSSLEQALFHPFPQPTFLSKEENEAPIQTAQPTQSTQASVENQPIFEPYHTVDYFASVGVKPPSLEQAKDRFGQQLKSFTDWLKEMKRLPLTEITRQIPVERENEVAALAHHSLDEKQVWTEAMAEVWLKQGERQKAMRIYEKLSLLDPSKSAYFAAKIETIKSES